MKALRLSVIYAVFLIVTHLFAQEMNPDAAKLYNEGNQKLKEGNYKAALQLYDQALNIQEDYRILYQRAITFRKLNELDKAYNDLTNVINLKPDFDLAYNALGILEYTRGNYQVSINNFLKALEVTKNSQLQSQLKKNLSLAYIKLADQSIKNYEYDKAIEQLTQALKYEPKNDAAYLALARSYVEKGSYNEAIEAADNALKYRKSIPKGGIYYYKGLALKNLGKINEAKLAFQEGLKDPTYKAVCSYEIKSLKE